MEQNSNIAVESAQNETQKNVAPSKGRAFWNATKRVAAKTAGGALVVGMVAVNLATVALPIAACVKYLRED